MPKFIPLFYESYNKSIYIAAILCILLFITFLIMSYLALKYETYNNQNKCDPMFYYGQSCRNLISNQILLNPDIVDSKSNFYKKLNNYNPTTQQFTGAEQTIHDSRQMLENVSMPALENAMENNKEFIRINENEINSMSSLLQNISLKYLGNVQNIIHHASNLPTSVQSQLQNIPTEIENLKKMVKKSLIDPAYAKYSAPLNKLYQSLTDVPKN